MNFDKMTTEMAKRAKLIEAGADISLANATAQPQMSVDKMADMYLNMRYEERQQMLLHLIGEQGMNGLQAAKRIMAVAYRKYGTGSQGGTPLGAAANPEAGQAASPIPVRAPSQPMETGMP